VARRILSGASADDALGRCQLTGPPSPLISGIPAVGSCTAIGIGRFARPAFLIAAELLAALILVLAASPASAQFFFDNRFTNGPARPGRAVQQQSQWFWPWQQWQQPVPRQVPRRMPRQAPPLADFSQAPPPRKQDTPPTTRVVVMGDSMADWLAYGFENAPDFVVMMIGLADRQTIGDRQIRNAAQQRAMQQSHEPPQPGGSGRTVSGCFTR
jgi:hypothetical protein